MKRTPTPRRRPRGPFASLAEYLDVTGATQEEVARAVGTTQAQISRIAAADLVPRPALAMRLHKHCHIPLDSFTRAYVRKWAPTEGAPAES